MQLVPRYLLKNRSEVVVNEAGFVTEYRSVYNRQLQVYKGIDNVLEFRALNADQKPVDVSGYTPKFQAFDENRNLIIEHDGVAVSNDDSAALRGLFTVTVSEADLLNVPQQYLSYSVHLVDTNGTATLTYGDTAFGNSGTMFVSGEAYPGPKNNKSITSFTQVGLLTSSESEVSWVSEAVSAEPGINGNEALHTAVIYTDGYVGNIVIQSTLANQVSDGTAWADVVTEVFDGSETEPKAINFNGVFSYVRVKATADPANTITKVLIRN